MQPSHQTVRLAQGRHHSPKLGACVMELASMLAGESFSDRPATVSPVIAAFLRTYNDGVDDTRRQDLYPLAALIVGTTRGRPAERKRVSRCLEFARELGASTPPGRAAIGIATAEASGSWAALAALRDGPSDESHMRALGFARELVALGGAKVDVATALWGWVVRHACHFPKHVYGAGSGESQGEDGHEEHQQEDTASASGSTSRSMC